MKRFQSGRHMAGVTLIEVMISVLILGVGMLGVAAMQTTALRNNQSALQRSQIVMQTYTILDAMRANRSAAMLGAYNTGSMLCTAPAAGDLVATDKSVWLNGLKDAIGGDKTTTCGSIACNDGNCTITVQWDDSRGMNSSANGNISGSATQTLSTTAQL
ncbi:MULTISPECIES: type IV pilus modification protein PilV [Xanthomonas]|uniref:Type IV pilus modification protein PilV n=1 Tax=Xanthomonas rydalmerensis TaxID=3046274 RepID=A0ABZ0JTG7_9XANT|nr:MULTISPECIES: type IV pilus modification protein PilV [unclassified Xanthomonas]MBB5943138.1 type IV pilus assembly protein PilV [Xanthomonas sp. 3307]MXV07261.1 type IV pilus modification protein PilV [Xanthomonas sp. LMG 9002]WOS42360.1 type IV pilus modification protein PilV [Xanthomonas sp. DM-2023]WOS46547.1 type IV pilus modification protein PilV [Xanthomonas sp. DM-2023]WOS50726.1 type IV pilus modification protein PilV [Xanthomonas sp. DM-2023]